MSIGEKLPRFPMKLKARDRVWSFVGLALKIIQDLHVYVDEDPRRLEKKYVLYYWKCKCHKFSSETLSSYIYLNSVSNVKHSVK